MPTYETLKGILWAAFSAETCLSDAHGKEILLHEFTSDAKFRSELQTALASDDLQWKELLVESWEIYPADSEEDAREWLDHYVCKPLRQAKLI